MSRTTLALVESPAQLLHVIEWCHSLGVAGDTRVAVLAPRDLAGRRQLVTMTDHAVGEGVAVELLDLRADPVALAGGLGRLWRLVAAAERLVLGDPFSGLIQAVLPAGRPHEVVVVDDGTATLDFADRLAAGDGLSRWDAGGGGAGLLRAPLGRRARRLLTPAPGRAVSLFTAMPVRQVPRVALHPNRYPWTRRRFGRPRVLPGTDVVGSSLVESGLVRSEAYLAAVADAATSPGSGGRYFAHRRETAAKLAEIAARTGLLVVRPEVPLEVEVRRRAVAARVVCFPSSVAFTLPVVLASAPARVHVVPVAADWLMPGVSDRARGFLARLAGYRQPEGESALGQRGTITGRPPWKARS